MLPLNLESQRIISACIDCQSSLSSGITNPWCQSTLRFKDSHLQESWNTSSEYNATTTPFSMNKEVQEIWQITSPDTPRTCTKRSMPWKWRRKTLLMPLCGPVYRRPLPSKKYSRQCAMTRKCKYYHNLFWTDISLNKTNQPGYHASTPAKNLPHQITSH